MGVIWTPGQRETQPQAGAQIAWDNPLAQALAFVSVGGQLVPFTRQPTTTAGTVTSVVTNQGRAHGFSSSGIHATPTPITAVPLTLAGIARVSTYASGGTLISIANSASSDNYWQLGLNTNGTIRAASRNSGYVAANSSNAVTVSKIFCAAALYVSATARYAWLDGVLSSVETTSSTPSGVNRVSMGVLGRDAAADYLAGDELIACAWSRVLSVAELAEFRRNPWQLFEPENDPVFYSLGGGGGVSVDVPAGAVTLTGYAPTVTAGGTASTSVPAGAVTLTAYAPTVTAVGTASASVPLGTVAIAGYAPTVSVGGSASIDVPLGAVALTGYAPTVTTGGQAQIDVPLGTVALAGYAPTVTTTEHAYIAVPTAAMALAAYAPTVTASGAPDIWTPVSASTGTWTPASAAGGTWTPQ